MEHKRKITKIDEQAYKSYVSKADNTTTYVHRVVTDSPVEIDGHQLNEFKYHSKTTNCVKFTVGEEATFTVLKEPFGNEYKIIPAKPQTKPAFVAGGKPFKAVDKDSAVITYLSCLSSVSNMFQGSSNINDWSKIEQLTEKAYQNAKAKRGDF